MDSRVRVILWMASPPTSRLIKYEPPLWGDKKKKRQLNHTVTLNQNWILSQYPFFFFIEHCISVRQTYLYPSSFMAKCPCPRNSKPSCLHQPLPKFLFTAELTDQTIPWCTPEPKDLLRVPSNAATRPAQALVIGDGGQQVCSWFPELPDPAHVPPILMTFQSRSQLKYNPLPSISILQLNL